MKHSDGFASRDRNSLHTDKNSGKRLEEIYFLQICSVRELTIGGQHGNKREHGTSQSASQYFKAQW